MTRPGYGSPFAGVYGQGGFGAYLLAYALTAALITALWYGLRYFLLVRGKKQHPGGTALPPESA